METTVTTQAKTHTLHLGRTLFIALCIALTALQLIQRPGTSTYVQIAGLLCIGWIIIRGRMDVHFKHIR